MITETIFAWPGLGRLAVDGDLPARLPAGAGRRVRRPRWSSSCRTSWSTSSTAGSTPGSGTRSARAAPRATPARTEGAARSPRSAARVARLASALARKRAGAVGLAILVLNIVVALAAPIVAPHDPLDQDVARRLLPPVWLAGGGAEHLLGTDQLGRDILSPADLRLAHLAGRRPPGRRPVAADRRRARPVAGYFGGRLDDVIMRIADIQLAFPFILLAITIAGVLGPSLRNVILILGRRRLGRLRAARARPGAQPAREGVRRGGRRARRPGTRASSPATCCRTSSRRSSSSARFAVGAR